MPPIANSPTEAIQYLSVEQALVIHEALIKRYGGSHGIYNQGLLESAIFRPQSIVFGQDAYPTLFEKCANLQLTSGLKNTLRRKFKGIKNPFGRSEY